ncbi:MAG: hypothetical protein ACI9EF_002407 [Pseudohongiellaceae bacterium]
MTRSRPTAGSRAHRGERGTVLILFAMLVFGILGLAALTIDLGLARATQESMQNAVDYAALEGLRGRDGDGADTPLVRELARRQAARVAILATFDEDLVDPEGLVDGSAPNTLLQLGIGPDVIETGTGVAGGQIAIGTSGGATVVLPNPQLNLNNFASGDLVAGNYLGFDPLSCEALFGLPPGLVETADYTRCDFDPSGAVSDATAAVSQDAFLARLRRTSDTLGLDSISGVSSNAPPLPYLFGRASLLDSTPGSALHDGLTVRATAVAAARPVLVAGLPSAAGAGLYLLPVDGDDDGLPDSAGILAFSVEAWSTCLADGSSHPVEALAGGGLQVLDGCPLAEAGRSLAVGTPLPGLIAVGQLPVDLGTALPPTTAGLAWVALYADIDPGAALDERVVGFGAVLISMPSSPSDPEDLRVQRLSGQAGDGFVASANATAIWISDALPTLTSSERARVLTAVASLSAPLLAPVLVH